LLNIKINRPKLVTSRRYKLAKFHGNMLSLSENIAKSLGGGVLFWLKVYIWKVSHRSYQEGL